MDHVLCNITAGPNPAPASSPSDQRVRDALRLAVAAELEHQRSPGTYALTWQPKP